jgi:hypothetical protein
MNDTKYSFVQIEERSERPTTRVPAHEPTKEELREKLAYTENQIALLLQRRQRILKKLGV